MKPVYVNYGTRAILDVAPVPDFPGVWRISRVNVPERYRGMGLGTKLLLEAIADADADGITLVLEPQPSGGLSFDQLVAWYGRHGFAWSGEPGYSPMYRRPAVESESPQGSDSTWGPRPFWWC